MVHTLAREYSLFASWGMTEGELTDSRGTRPPPSRDFYREKSCFLLTKSIRQVSSLDGDMPLSVSISCYESLESVYYNIIL